MPIRVLRGDRWLDLELSPVELAETDAAGTRRVALH